MRINPLVAFEVEEFSQELEWTSAVVTGHYEELAQHGADGETAWKLLQQYPMWWEPGYAKTVRNDGTQRSLEPIYFRIRVDNIDGHQALASLTAWIVEYKPSASRILIIDRYEDALNAPSKGKGVGEEYVQGEPEGTINIMDLMTDCRRGRHELEFGVCY